ncbi:MAG: alkaline phosphatase family protein [Myxococcota bacterium]
MCRAFVLLLLLSACTRSTSKGPTEAEAKEKLAACTFGPGALAKDTLPGAARVGSAMPIDHFVLVMQENRSFDHYYSRLTHGGVHVAGSEITNPDALGNPVKRYHETRYCIRDVNHSWSGSHRQYNDGKMDGFVVTNEPEGARAMGYFDETDLPFYYALSRTFAISDMHFSSVMGPTQPNRLYYWAGTSFGAIRNGLPPQGAPSLFTRLNDANVRWNSYVSDVASPAVFVNLLSANNEHFRPIDEFFADAAAGKLPPVSVVEATFTGGVQADQTDEHPASNIQHGQAFTAKVVNAVLTSPQWPRTALIFLYDEHGGFFDSVPPPKACEPDELRPIGDEERRFDHLGFRTPLIVVSPFARRGYVSHVPVDHTAVLRLVEARFELPALTRRDANAWPLLDLFDFEHPDVSVPKLPEAVIDPERDAACKRDF